MFKSLPHAHVIILSRRKKSHFVYERRLANQEARFCRLELRLPPLEQLISDIPQNG